MKDGVEVLYDDCEASAGEKFADADLIAPEHDAEFFNNNIKLEQRLCRPINHWLNYLLRNLVSVVSISLIHQAYMKRDLRY